MAIVAVAEAVAGEAKVGSGAVWRRKRDNGEASRSTPNSSSSPAMNKMGT